MNGRIRTIRIHAEVFAAPRWLRTMSAMVRTQITRRISPSSPPKTCRNTAMASSATGSATSSHPPRARARPTMARTGVLAGMPALRTRRTPRREARPVLREDRPGTAPPDGGPEPLREPEPAPAPPARVLRERYGLLFIATIALLGVQGAVPPGGVQQVVVTALAGATLLLAFRAAFLSRTFVAIAGGVTVAAVAVSVLRAAAGGIGEGVALTMNAVLVAMGPPAIAVGIVRDLRATRQVGLQTVAGVL